MFCLAIGLLIVLGCGVVSAAEPLPYAIAYQEFHQSDRPLLVLVTSRGCGPCRLFKARTFLPAFKDGRLSRVVPTVVEMEADGEIYESICLSAGIKRIPALVLYRKGGPKLVKEVPTQADLDFYSQAVPDIR